MTSDSTPAGGLDRRGFLKRGAAATVATGAVTMAPAAVAQAAAEPARRRGARPMTAPPGAIIASSFGWNNTDTTANLQNAINAALAATATGDTVLYLDKQAEDWITGPLVIGLDPAHPKGSGHLTVQFEPGTTLRAKQGAYDGTVALFDTVDVCLLTIAGTDAGELISGITIDGYGGTIAMNKPEYNAGEWRHALSILSADNITVRGLTLRDSGGDGIYLGIRYNKAHTAMIGQQYCSNITLTDVCCDNNRRNGMSVISVDTLTVTGCAFQNTFGTPPMAGIDFEPDPPRTNSPFAALPWGRLKNISVSSSRMTDNVGYAVNVNALCLGGAPAANGPMNIAFSNVKFGATSAPDLGTFIVSVPGDNGDPTPVTSGGIGTGPGLPGAVTVTDSLIDSRLFNAAIRTQAMPDNSAFQLKFTRTAIFNDAYSRAGKYEPIALLYNAGPDTAEKFGGVDFTDCTINTNHANPLIVAYPKAGDANSACTGLTGNITAYVPTVGAAMNTANISPTTNSLVVTEVVTPAAAGKPAVSVTTSTPAVSVGGTATFTFTRSGGDTTQTLAVAYSMTGDAAERYDYPGQSGCLVFAPNQTTATLSFATRRPDGGTGTRTANLEILHADAYVYGTSRIASVAIS